MMTQGKHSKSSADTHPVAHENAATASFAVLTNKLAYLSSASIDQIRGAYRFADEVHLGQWRKNGLPYITHPLAVAALCADWKLDVHAVMAAILHDTMEDCHVTKLNLVERFGLQVADLVDGLTKLDKLQFNSREESQAESFRKMLLAMARDIRIILVKLSDRLHNMRTLSDMPATKRERVAQETLDIYAPIAHRLGLNSTYRELQNLAFKYLKPWRFAVLSKAVERTRQNRRNLVKNIHDTVAAAFEKAGLHVQLEGREKTIYSLYRKMVEKHLTYSEVHDIFGFRVLVDRLLNCYTAIGVLHQIFQPVPGKFKDHIAIPKINGYQSLHTVVAGPAGVLVEFQTRTQEMHIVAESGLAAHWIYKTKYPEIPENEPLNTHWIQSLLDIQNETTDSGEFWDHVKVDLFPDAVYVFTPKNRILALPRGATVVDFAYAIHSNIGDHAVSARINGEPAALRTELYNGDVIEVLTASGSNPNPTWLDFVHTGRARSRIRHFLKNLTQNTAAQLGENLLTQALYAEGIAQLPSSTDEQFVGVWEKLLRITESKTPFDLFSDIGLGKRFAGIVAKKMQELLLEKVKKWDMLSVSNLHLSQTPSTSTAIFIDGNEGAAVQYASCCHPLPGDGIVGYLGRGEGLSMHTDTCKHAALLKAKNPERFILVEWSDQISRSFICRIEVVCENIRGTIAKIASIISKYEGDIVHIDMDKHQSNNIVSSLRISISLHDRSQLEQILSKLNRSAIVRRAIRI